MCPEGMFLCPRLKGHVGGARCEAADDFVRNMMDVNIKICMGRHYEACHIYQQSLAPKISVGEPIIGKNDSLNTTVTAA